MAESAEGFFLSPPDKSMALHNHRSLSPLTSLPSSSTRPPATGRVRFWVSPPPSLDPSERALYKPATEVDILTLEEEEDETPMEVHILNEIRAGTELFFWIRINNVIYKRLAQDVVTSYPEAVEDYNKRKEEGLLEEVDIYSSRIHTADRARRPSELHPGRSKRAIVVDSSEDEDTSDEYNRNGGESEVESDEDDRKVARATRHSTRNAVKKVNIYRELSTSPVKVWRNTRSRSAATKERDTYVESDEDTDEQTESSYQEESDKKTPAPKKVRGRLSRPAYGNIRSVADLSDDEESDGEDAALHAHQKSCNKCHQAPAHKLLNHYYQNPKRRRSRKKNEDEQDELDEEQRLTILGGWVRCIKCTIACHWKCLSRAQRDEIMKAYRAKITEGRMPPRKDAVGAYETTEFFCNGCIGGGICMYCQETAVKSEAPPSLKSEAATNTQTTTQPTTSTPPPSIVLTAATPIKSQETTSYEARQAPVGGSSNTCNLIFRCAVCQRLAHYEHLPQPDGDTLAAAEVAAYYQSENDWKCSDCVSYVYSLDKILAWRPYPADVVEPPLKAGEVPDHKHSLPREYLVKWADRSYRRLQWVPHMWLLSTSQAKLKNFLATGPKVRLLEQPREEMIQEPSTSTTSKEATPAFLVVDDNSARASAFPEEQGAPPSALADAEKRVPAPWRTVDRVLDVFIWDPLGRKRAQKKKEKKVKRRGRPKRYVSDESEAENGLDVEEQEVIDAERAAAFEYGEQPSEDHMETVEQWELRTGEKLSIDEAPEIAWVYVKWDELPYEEATWDAPPKPDDPGYPAFEKAFQQYLDSRDVQVTIRNKQSGKQFDIRRKKDWVNVKLNKDPELGQQGNLMDFQLIGLNWLLRNWWDHQPSILADEMGLGKTVQIATFVGHVIESFEAAPVLIIVPNATITNWIREFSRWAPRLRVVPYYGEAKSREIIRNYELYHDTAVNPFSNLKFHVLVTTYDTMIGKDFSSIFKSVGRWELLIVDEGQRLKNDSSILFRRLNELNSVHRILMTGTPLNNNIRELFNLMNFLDPEEWTDLKGLEKEYEELTEDLLLTLHDRLKPYFLRRTKADVLKLPPKNEVIVPVSMTGIQKEVYKSILSQNLALLGKLSQTSSRVNPAAKKSNLNNILMQLRKCLQHPYLISRELEPGGDLSQDAIHKNLIDASAKMRLLQTMLPKLKARGHRVLLFSQFTMALDIIEDFVQGEGYKFLRLDGNIKQHQRQLDMDVFNRPDSDIFIYLLSTRAGGVGINLWSADTVIIFDPDFNPHQDLQAISRAHRYGQTKTVLVFKLMVKDAAEERIIHAGKKKLALEHLIVQKMDEGASDDVQSILTFGAKALFENEETNVISYTDADVEKLIDRTEKEGDQAAEVKVSSAFNFAKLWVVEKDAMEEIIEEPAADQQEPSGFWDTILARAAKDKAQNEEGELNGPRPKRRAAAVVRKYVYDDGSPEKKVPAKRRKSNTVTPNDDPNDEPYHTATSSDGEFSLPGSRQSSVPLSDIAPLVTSAPPGISHGTKPNLSNSATTMPNPILSSIGNKQKQKRRLDDDSDEERNCGLCHAIHGPGECYMTENPAFLVEYRAMILAESKEPLELKRLAVQAIDERLVSRGLIHLLKGQQHTFPYADSLNPHPHKKRKKQTEVVPLKNPNVSSASKVKT